MCSPAKCYISSQVGIIQSNVPTWVRTNIARILHVHCDQMRIVSCCDSGKLVLWDFTMQGKMGDITQSRRVDALFF